MKKHHLKTIQPYYDDILKRQKRFEIRKNDRDFKLGDWLILKEYDPKKNKFTGNELEREIMYMTDFEQKENYVVMGIW